MATQSDIHKGSVRRDAWRTDLLIEQVREDMLARRRADALRGAIGLGIALGVLGSFCFHWL